MVKIPYGNGFLELFDLPENREILRAGMESETMTCGEAAQEAEERISAARQDEIVLEAMKNPICAPRLAKLAEGKSSAVIIISDHTRPVPSRHIIPHMLKELREASPDIDITLLVATGFHRGTTKEELTAKLGDDIAKNERIVVHDCQDEDSLKKVGILPSGARFIVNRLALETDLLISEGFIEPHFFAGFSGGRKSVLPGICSRETVLGNHCAVFIDSPYARSGNLENNPMHEDMLAACRMVNLRYIVNVTIDEKKQVTAAFAGDPEKAHRAGCDALQKHCSVKPIEKGDIVITSNGGAPLDQNVYQAVKGLCTAESAAKPGAVLIMCAACSDGSGGDDFYQAVRDCTSPEQLLADIRKVPMDQTKPDQWEYQILARILSKHQVVFVTEKKWAPMIKDMKMLYAESLEKALEAAWRLKGKDCRHVIIPDGIGVIIEP